MARSSRCFSTLSILALARFAFEYLKTNLIDQQEERGYRCGRIPKFSSYPLPHPKLDLPFTCILNNASREVERLSSTHALLGFSRTAVKLSSRSLLRIERSLVTIGREVTHALLNFHLPFRRESLVLAISPDFACFEARLSFIAIERFSKSSPIFF